MSEATTTLEMTHKEFSQWAGEIVADAVITGGFREMRRTLDLVIQQQMMIYHRNGGFQQEKKK